MQRISFVRSLTVLIALIASASWLFAEQGRETRVIPMGVYTSEGRFIPGVKSERVRVEGVPTVVREVALDTGPRRVVLLLDLSASMGSSIDSDRWPHATQMAKEFLGALRPDDWVALHVFAKTHEALVPFTHDFDLVASRIDALPRPGTKEAGRAHGGLTLLGDALAKILAARDRESQFGDAIVLVSDGEYGDEGKIRLSKLKHKLGGIGLRVFLLRVAAPDLGRYGPAGSEIFTTIPDFVRETGGVTLDGWQPFRIPSGGFFAQTDPRLIRSTALTAYSLIRNLYRVELETAGPITKSRKITLKVVDEQGRKLKDVDLIYPRYLEPQVLQP